jgi:hypothetical protein
MARKLAPLLALAALLGLSSPAQASLIGQTLAVRLTDGGSLDASDSVLAGAGPELTPGDGSDIGALLLPNEAIDFSAFAIEIALEEGTSGGATGYPAGTRYVFSDLSFGDPLMVISGVAIGLDNLSGVALGSEVLFTQDSVTLYIDDLVIGEIPNAVDVGSVTLSLAVTVIPEPGTLALLGLGLAALSARRRRV